MQKNLKSIKFRIIGLIVTFGIVLTCSLSVIFPKQARHLGNEILIKDAGFIANLLSENVALGIDSMILDDGASLENTLKTMEQVNEDGFSTIASVRIFDIDLNFVNGFGHDYKNPPTEGAVKERIIKNERESLWMWMPVVNALGDANGFVELTFSKSHLNSQAANNRNFTLLFGISINLITLFLAWLLTHSIVRPIVAMRDFMADLSKGAGNLSKRIQGVDDNEIGELALNFNKFIDKLRDIILEIRDNTNAIDNVAQSLVGSAVDLADGSKSQNAQTKDASSSINVVSSAVYNSYERSESLATNANDNAELAVVGKEAVNSLLGSVQEVYGTLQTTSDTIDNLNRRSEEISKVMSVIKEIADNTNLLALNAAIEAARAGEHGRGFSVVADEVRALASQTTKSAEEVYSMVLSIQAETEKVVAAIGENKAHMDPAINLAKEALEKLEKITDSSDFISNEISQLLENSREQNEAISQIDKNMHLVEQVTERNAESSSAMLDVISRLTQQVGSLNKIESQFKL